MSTWSCIRGDPEMVFSFDDRGEIVFNIKPSTVNGWRLEPLQTPYKVNKYNILLFIYLFIAI